MANTGLPDWSDRFYSQLFLFRANRGDNLFSKRPASAPGPKLASAIVAGHPVCCIELLDRPSIKLLPLANAVALIHSAPLMITALAAILLAERVGFHRWCAVIIGFIGILIMARPTADAFQLSAFVAVGAAAATALRDIVTRKMGTTESTKAILAFSTAALILVSGLTTHFYWISPNMVDLALMAASGVLMGTAHYLLIEAYRWAEAGIVSPFKYTSLIWATLLGYLIWGDLPDQWVISGAALIMGGGLYVLHREAKRQS